MRVSLGLICFFICLFTNAQNETESFNIYTTKEGLSSNSIFCLIQDSRKFLWMGTKEGLNRFDGNRFKIFYKQRDINNSLSGNFVLHILEYKPGHLLISTTNGLSVLNTLTGEFENEKIDYAPLKAGSGTLTMGAGKTYDGHIWVNHDGELEILDSTLKYLYRLSDLPWAKTLKGSLITKPSFIDKQHRLWLPTDTSGIQIIDFSAKQVWNRENNPQKLPFLSSANVFTRCFLLDEVNNILWYGAWGNGLTRHDLVTHKEDRIFFDRSGYSELTTVNSIIQKTNHTILCAMGEGLYELDIQSLSYTKLIGQKPGGTIISAKNNQFWIGSALGLIQLKNQSGIFKDILLAGRENFIPGYCSSVTTTKDGRLYAIYRHNVFVEIEKDRDQVHMFPVPGRKGLLLTKLSEDTAGRLWVGTNDGVYLFDTLSKKFSKPEFLPQEFQKIVANFIYCDHSGNMWVGTRAPFFLYRFNMPTNRLERITNNVIKEFTALYDDSRVSRITEDKENLWMTSNMGGGIIQLNKNSGEWKRYPVNKERKSLMVDRGIFALCPDEHNLWIAGGISSGLMCYNYVTDSLSRFTREDGLGSEYIENMAADQSGNLWISNENGIAQFDVKTHKVVSYNLQNRSASRYENDEHLFDPVTNSIVRALDDRLLFIAVNRLKKDTIQVTPVIDKIIVNNKELFIDASAQKPILNYQENNISIDFTAVDFSDLHVIHFAYQLSGLDTGWRFTDAIRSAQYANLAPGDYVFKIKTANESGEWSRPYDAFSFSIRPVFWQTTWFRFSVIAFISFILFWLVNRRIKVIRREAGLKHKIAEAEMLALRSQMNPHFIFNCLNAIDSLIQTNQPDKATTYLARFAKLIRSVLESSKNNVVPFHKDFETLRLFLELEQFRSNNKFVYEITADKELLEGDYKVPPLIIQPFIENAIHHGLLNKESGERKLLVKASLENNTIKYIVQDNGVGRTKAQEIKEINKPEHVSYGIQITSERIHLHNQDEKINDVVFIDHMEEDGSGGTTVKIRLKIQ